uniref:Uncharacterized protein n=1 Tax=virus sp. ctnRj46 TaxID=2826814 RepID=A0A8S5R6X1_9VIRU|nr:MAG TPA: hypothetical protein [virus sp. ctnRj46]
MLKMIIYLRLFIMEHMILKMICILQKMIYLILQMS